MTDRYRPDWEKVPDNWYSWASCTKCPTEAEYTVNTTWTPDFIASIMLWWHRRKVHNGTK